MSLGDSSSLRTRSCAKASEDCFPAVAQTSNQETAETLDVTIQDTNSAVMPSKSALLKRAALSPLSILSILPIPNPQQLLLRALSLGPIPRHVAFIMDGNRRWARTSQQTIRQGHLSGFATLKRVLEVCLNLRGLDTVTVYAFAIDNFRRTESEVNALMDIAKTRLIELAGHGELIARYSVRVRIVGRKELLPKDVLEAVERVENITKANSKATLNICMPYASRDEMTGAARSSLDKRLRNLEKEAIHGQADIITNAAKGTNDPGIGANASLNPELPCKTSESWHAPILTARKAPTKQVSGLNTPLQHQSTTDPPSSVSFSIDANDLAKEMQLAHSPPLDILVRTSGVSRLSDFMLWQCNSHTQLYFVNKYWPQFGLLDMVTLILDWQRRQWS